VSVDRAVRAQVFGEVAELYDAVRPGYLDATVDEVLAYADLGDRPAVEVGAGTGKATVAFAARGLPIVCVEPDPRMARVLRRNVARFPGVRVEEARFEDWRPAGRPFGLLYAAASWHWVDADRRASLAHAALVPGGTLAVLGNAHRVLDRDLLAALTAIDAEHGLGETNHKVDLAFTAGTDAQPAWPMDDMAGDARFTDFRTVTLHARARYETAQYLDYIRSTSIYLIAPEQRRAAAFAAMADLLDRHGGGIDLALNNLVMLARTAAT
jgi:SAM-dependent methyltransferase